MHTIDKPQLIKKLGRVLSAILIVGAGHGRYGTMGYASNCVEVPLPAQCQTIPDLLGRDYGGSCPLWWQFTHSEYSPHVRFDCISDLSGVIDIVPP